MGSKDDREQLEKELAYYKRRVDELSGENLKLDYTISGLRHEIKQKRQGFALVSDLQQTVGAEKQISTIFDTVIEAINSMLGMDRTLVLSPTEEEHAYRPRHLMGFREDVVERLTARSFVFPPGFQDGSELLLVNKATEPTPLTRELSEALDLPFFLAAPVMGEQGPIGILLSGRLKEARPLYPPLDQGDVDTFQAIAGLVSASVRNMRVAVLEEMDRLKTDFFANISHEFRTPIALTIGPLDQLLTGRYGEIPPTARRQIEVMRRNQERLLGLVSQILDLAKLEAGGMQLAAERVGDANRFVEERVAPFRPAAEERGVELGLRLDPEARDVELYLDREKFDKLLFNLLSNAMKFTREGRIDVVTKVEGHHFRLIVNDTGVGIKEDQLPHIFDRFRQADGSESREFAGTGIGLALVQEVAELHGGAVSVLSQYGRGSSFRVTLPLGTEHLSPSSIVQPAGEGEREKRVPGLAPMIVEEGAADRVGVAALNEETQQAFDPDRPTLVYAEDNPDLREHLRDLLKDDFNIFLAVDGREGLDAVRRYRPDLVITDQMMPVMSGRDLLVAIRDDEELRSVPVIFLTARAGTDARIESLEASADDYLTKPFHEGELLARVRNLIRAREQERQVAELNRRLESRVEEQLAELVRTGELRQFLPPALAEHILEGGMRQDGESFDRRKITVLSAEVVGFQEATDALEPEDLSTLVNDYLRELTSIAISRGGTVETSGAGRLTVLFGAPGEMELEAQAAAAVGTALAMRERMDALAAEWRRRGVPEGLALRAGVNTGYCTVGVYGSDLLRSYTAVGAPAAMASALAAEAAPGQVLVALATHGLVQERVRSESGGTFRSGSFGRPVEAFVVTAMEASARPERAGGSGPAFMPK